MNIFVAKLNYATTEDTLRSAFEFFGEVDSVKIIIDRETDRSKGYGFVEMPNDEEGQAAIDAINGSQLDGREIVAKKAEPRGQGGGGRGGFGGGGGRGGFDRGGRGGGGGYDRGGRGGYDRGGRDSRGGYDRGGRSNNNRDDRYY